MEEHETHENCPNCERAYDEIDHDYQVCSKCGYDADKKCFLGIQREPTYDDYLNGDADMISGQWY